MNIRKIIKEELLKEVGGYDDFNIMGLHVSKTIGTLTNVYNDLTNTVEGLANAIMDGATKEDLTQYLVEVSEEIKILTESIQKAITDFTENDLIVKAKSIIKSLKSFKRKIDVLSNFSADMGDEKKFILKLKTLLMDLIPSIGDYGDQLNITNKMFSDRLSGKGSGSFGIR